MRQLPGLGVDAVITLGSHSGFRRRGRGSPGTHSCILPVSSHRLPCNALGSASTKAAVVSVCRSHTQDPSLPELAVPSDPKHWFADANLYHHQEGMGGTHFTHMFCHGPAP